MLSNKETLWPYIGKNTNSSNLGCYNQTYYVGVAEFETIMYSIL